jgi:hypothetical protein
MRTGLLASTLLVVAFNAHAGAPSFVATGNSLWVAQNEESLPKPRTEPGLAIRPDRHRDYALPALEILGFDFLLNRFNHAFSGSRDYDVTGASIRRNLRSGWGTDRDPFNINQLGHPYQGSMYHGFARSAGLDFWQSMGLTFVGSIGWELFGENTPPSRNDQVASGIGGAFLGEALFRMASLVLETGGGIKSPFWREVAAAAISPSTGFNRNVMGLRTVFDSHNPAYYSRLSLGLRTGLKTS